MKNYTLAAVGAFLCLSQLANADSYSPQYRRTVRSQPVSEDTFTESPWYLFIGGDLGISNYSPYNNSATETSRSGFNGGVRGLVAHYWDSVVLDGGAGWTYVNNSGTNSDGTKNSDTSKVVYFDISPRYRFGRYFQIGPELEYWISTDQGLNPTSPGTDTITTASNNSLWLGAQGLFEWTENQKVRLGARALFCMNAEGRSVQSYQGFVQIGFDVFSSSRNKYDGYEQVNERDLERAAESRRDEQPLNMSTPEPRPEASPEPLNPDPEVMSTPAPPSPEEQPSASDAGLTAPLSATSDMPMQSQAKNSSQRMLIALDMNDLPFGYNNAVLPKSSASRIKNMGTYLGDHNRIWKKLIISGHVDERGTKAFGQKLSESRAEKVRELLVEGGANGGKIQIVGYGSSRPKDTHHNERAWARNRRVELDFQGVSDAKILKKILNQ